MTIETVRVLMVDDNPWDVEIVQRMLQKYRRVCFQLFSAGSTEECSRALRENAFDLVLLDQNFPGEDGLAFLRRMEERSEMPPIIMLTAVGSEQLAAEALRLGVYDYLPKDSINSEVLALAIHRSLEKYRLDQQLEHTEQIIFSLAAAVEAKDPATEAHLQRMPRYALEFGTALGLDTHRLLMLKYGAILHDVGKIGVSDHILDGTDSLTETEWDAVRQHPIIGERICASLRFAHEVGPIIRHHHERWDGKGYPDSLRGEEIPLLARIVSVVDAFDSMYWDRPYRKALAMKEVIGRLSDGAGSQWDPKITPVFVDLIKSGGLSQNEVAQEVERQKMG